VSQEHESAGGAQFSWSQLVGTSSQNRKRQRPNDPNDPDAHGLRRTRTDDGKERAKNQTSTDGGSPRTPLPSTGTKCSCNGLQATDDNPSEQAIDTKALYTANKEEIEHWYDEDFSRKQGIPIGGKLLMSNHTWYQKVDAWMKMKGFVQSPEKKRKLTDGTPLSPEPQEQDEENHKLKPHQIKCSDDWRSVPEYPYDKLEDYTPNSEGRYACLHNHINAPKSCCKDGLTRTGKKSAIKKDVVRWKGKVEKLIDKGELDKRHMTWPDWTVRELRMKHQPALWAKQEAKRKADLENRRRHEEMQTERLVRMNRENEKRTQGQQAVDQQSAIAQLTPSPDLPQRRVLRMIPTIIGPASPSVPHLPEQGPAHRPITTTRRSSDPTTASAHQPSATMAQASMHTQQLGPQTPLPIAETVDPPFDLSASATTYDLDDSREIEAVVPLDGPLEQPILQIP
jgi:hypothetical protein